MKISPLDIRKQNFKRALRGVDPEEVRMFLEVVASEYEKVLQDNAMMAEKLRYQDQRLDEYRELERSMRNSLVTADRIANESREASEREAGRIIQDAHTRAERILEDSRERLQKLVQDVESLRSKKDIYVRRFRTMLEAQLSVLNEQGQQFDEIHGLENSAHSLLANSQGQLDSESVSLAAEDRENPKRRPEAASRNGKGSASASVRPFRMSVVPPPVRGSRSTSPSAPTGSPHDVHHLVPESVASFEIDAHETAATFPSPSTMDGQGSGVTGASASGETPAPARSPESGDLFGGTGATAAEGSAAGASGQEPGHGTDAPRADAPSEPTHGMADVRGVGRFFRRTHAKLALEGRWNQEETDEAAPPEAGAAHAGSRDGSDAEEMDDAEFFKAQQRTEGFFEIDAAERSRKA